MKTKYVCTSWVRRNFLLVYNNMDACDPRVDIKNLKRLIKQNTGVELKLTRNQICNAYSSIQANKLPLPPLVLSKDGRYMIDRKSPLNENDFEVLFNASSTLSQLKRVARKTGLVNYKTMTKNEIVESIGSFLQSKNVHEPIRIRAGTSVRARAASTPMRTVSVNRNEYPNNLNVNNVNGNGIKNNINSNLENISREASNVENNTVTPNNGTRERTPNNGTTTPPAKKSPNYYNWFAREKARSQVNEKNQRGENTLKNVIKKLGRSSDPRSRNLMTQINRAIKTNNKVAIEQLKRKLGVSEPKTVNNKQSKITELEKYAVDRSKKLRNKGVEFMNISQGHIKAYTNGVNLYNTTKMKIKSTYDKLYKQELNASSFTTVANTLQKEHVNKITNNTLKSNAMGLLEKFKETGSTTARNNIIKLHDMDEGFGKRQETVMKLFGNRKPLNELRNEALQNINTYNIRNGLAKIDTRIEQKKKERGVQFNTLFKNVQPNIRTKLINKYMSGEMNNNDVRRALNNATEENAGVLKGFENKIRNLENKLNNSKLTVEERNALKQERNNLKQRMNTNAKNMNVMREQLGNLKVNRNAKEQNIQKLKNELAKSTSPNVRNKLQANLNQALKNQFQSQIEYQALQNEKNRQNALYAQLKSEKLSTNSEIQSIKNKLNANKSMSNDEKRALQEQLNEALGNKSKLNNQLKKSENEKMNYMRQMNALAENVRKQKENANVQIKNLKNQASVSETLAKQAENKLANIESSLRNQKMLTEQQREELEQQLLIQKQEVSNAQRLANKAKENANAAVIESRRLVNEAEAQRQKALNNKAAANAARNAARIEAQQSASAAKAANTRAKEIEEQLKRANLTKKEMNALIQQKNALLETRRKEMQNQINAISSQFNTYKTQANKIVRNSATRESAQKNKLNLATQRLAVKNANLIKKSDEIRQIQLNIARLQQQMKNNKNASNTEKNALRREFEKEKQNLGEIMAKTKTELNSTLRELQKITANRNILFKELQNRSTTLAQVRQNLNKTKQELNTTQGAVTGLQTNLQKSRVAGAWKGAAARGLSTQMKNTRTNLNRAQKEIGVARGVVEGLVGQRQQALSNLAKSRFQGAGKAVEKQLLQTKLNNTSKQKNAFRQKLRNVQQQRGQLRKEVGVARGVVEGLIGQRQELQQKLSNTSLNQSRAGIQLAQARKSAKNMRAQLRSEKQPNFNATAAFQRMGNTLNQEKRQMIELEKNKLRNLINSRRPNGNFTIGGAFGKVRRDLKTELNKITQMGELGRFKLKVNKAKNDKNTEIARKRMNKILNQL